MIDVAASGCSADNAVALTAWATILLVFVTAGLVFVAWRQFETTRAQLRAYLLPVSVGLAGTDQQRPLAAQLFFKNSGQTPAYKVQTWGNMKIVKVADEATALSIEKNLRLVTPFTIGPDQTMPKRLFCEQPSFEEMQGITALPPTHRVYVYGRVIYVDAFKNKRYSDFRYSYSGEWPPPIPHFMNVASGGNESN